MQHVYLEISNFMLWVVVMVQAYLMLVLLRQVGILNLRIVPAGARSVSTGPKVGEKAPELQLSDMRDSSRILAVPSDGGQSLMMVFVSPGCSSCKQLTPGINTLFAESSHDILWAVIALGSPSECSAFQKQYFNSSLMFCHGNDRVRDLYEIATTPYAILMRPDATVLAAGIVNHIEHLESMIALKDVEFKGRPDLKPRGDGAGAVVQLGTSGVSQPSLPQ